jgi:DNA-binding transcriptional LysR family regulator
LTALGELLRPMLQEVLTHTDLSRSAAREFLREDQQMLKLGILSSIWPDQFAPFLSRFAAQHRKIRLKFIEADNATLQKLLLGGDLDYAVGACDDNADGRLRRYALYREGMVAVIPHGHPLESQTAVRLKDLEGVDLLLPVDHEMRPTLIEACRKQEVAPVITYHNDQKGWIQVMVAAGAGITVMPEYSHFCRGTLVRPLIEPPLARSVSLFAVAGRPHNPAGNMLVRAIRAEQWSESPTSGGVAAA